MQGTAIRDIPMVLSPQCRKPPPIELPYTYQPVPDNITDLIGYDFSFERSFLETLRAEREQQLEQQRLRAARKEKREQLRKERERQRAPGLSDGPIQPQPAASTKPPASQQGPLLEGRDSGASTPRNVPSSPKVRSKIDYAEFELGIAPLDPWDAAAKKDDLNELMEVYGEKLSLRDAAARPPAPASGFTSPPQVAATIASPPNAVGGSPGFSAPPSFPGGYPTYVPPVTGVYPSGHPGSSNPSGFRLAYPGTFIPAESPTPPPIKPKSYSSPRFAEKPLGGDPASQPSGMHQRLVGMGFTPASVAKACSRFAKDEKKAVDYLVLFGQLSKPEYSPDDVDDAISCYPADPALAASFLVPYKALLEMGYAREPSQRALVKHKNSLDAALDELQGE
ncbi:uncharacterized protein BJ171DRAFT_487558 [Polychytrium aggregatum]|uniref:uncharacterized protein n=1 Tax=Polychytrium aggregatum TaxID=110093 RepID=UPI0022FF2618|nr:uncharacterized protein BJ171DRAFT_487558 [Polychytrium aggregatum]KAI9208887.1 hypothetical protein BJ171DRAFT_487558 [Polychytrium aggregatum]